MHTLGARDHLARFRPHPIARRIAAHANPSSDRIYVWSVATEFNLARYGTA
jgi:hypothetical protein